MIRPFVRITFSDAGVVAEVGLGAASTPKTATMTATTAMRGFPYPKEAARLPSRYVSSPSTSLAL